ncbi:phytoene dehydrogenase-like protein [Neolewinella xylanilytica]|uniref:Pyridine nucleotide-disulfide oxidoreductase domain-containing protein 2 n=1 Tax=Neolewinella xylanilytica TaxID=1514080 RepID=A0A2S6I5D9_9BACT|nr:NAD(P)/FAD-dependent oxidoreductase [Neolewinella xylanilytica]PPK86365.1 phytoene dehydrogenase-like protein [Neolewinella xylanilytica]
MTKHTIIIGSGINSLCAAVVLATSGQRVTVFEKNDWLGGNILTKELSVPGFRHEIFSGFHPLFTSGPFYREFRTTLEAYGVTYLNTEYTAGVLLPDGRALALRDNRDKNVAALNGAHSGDGDAYRRVMTAFDQQAELAFGLLSKELWSLGGAGLAAKNLWSMGPEGLLEFFGEALPDARKWLDNTFRSDLVRAALAPWTLHTGMGPDDAGGSLMLRIILASFENTGMPVAEGGGTRLVEALTRIITDNGGECHTASIVDRIVVEDGRATGVEVAGQLHPADRVLANVSPTALYGQLLPASAVPQATRQEADDYRYGRGNMQIQLSLDHPPRWPNPVLLKTGMVHVTPGMNGTSRAVNEAVRGLLPAEPTIVVGQHTAIDPSRAPEGKWTIWIQLQELPASPTGDSLGEIDCHGEWTEAIAEAYADRVIAILDRQLPGFAEDILERHVLSPADLARINPNLVGGDPYCGKASLDQFLFWRPLPGMRGHETPVTDLYHIGAATHPGPGLNGTSGYLVAKQLT